MTKGDEPDALGLRRGGTLAYVPMQDTEVCPTLPDRALGDVPTTLRNGILVQSKAFDAKTYLSTVHPQATFKDLSRGRENLKGPLGLSCVLLQMTGCRRTGTTVGSAESSGRTRV
jgi:exocyst complex component 2